MDDKIELISDDDGIAVIGDREAVETFLAAEGLPSRDLGLPRLASVLRTGSIAAQGGSELAANSGRWVKLTPKSAEALKMHHAMKGSSPGVRRAVLTDKGKTKHILEFAKGPGARLTNPAVLAGAAGIMAQLAMQQTMDEITDYLATIDEKVDDVLRAQKDTVLARMIGAGLVIDEAMTIREHGGRVSEVTWSKVQAVPATVAETQAYALRQLDTLAEKMERTTAMGDLAKAAKGAEPRVREWLAVLARCYQLQDAIAVLELDRVLSASSEDLEGHRRGLRAARQDRKDLISGSTKRLMARMDAAAGTADRKVLLTRARQQPWCVRGTRSRSLSSTSTGCLGSKAVEPQWRGGGGRTRLRTHGTGRWCQESRQWAPLGAVATRLSTGQGRRRASSRPGFPSERSVSARTRASTNRVSARPVRAWCQAASSSSVLQA